MFNFLHTYNPSPILLSTSYFSIHWYGIAIAFGGIIGLCLVIWLSKKYKINKVLIYDYLFYSILVSIIFARIYYIIYNWQYYSTNFNAVFKIWEGGLAIHGAMIGGLIVLIAFSYKHKFNIWSYLDILVVGLIVGQIFGRWGNYFNQELFGTPTNLPWGIPIETSNRPEQYISSQYFHPTFLYESILNFVLLVGLLVLHFFKIKKNKIKEGTIAICYFIGYSLIRIFTETLRTDYTPFIFGIRWAQIISVIIIVASIFTLFYKYKKK